MTNVIFGVLALLLVVWQVRPVMGVRRIHPSVLRERLAAGELFDIVDVRTPEEFANGHIAGARSVPLAEIRSRAGELDRAQPTVLVCRSGYRAMQAFHILRRRQFNALWVLAGGMLAWQMQAAGGVGHGSG